MKKSLLAAALLAVATARREEAQAKRVEAAQQWEPEPLPIEPGHVMSKKSYERLVREQQK